MISKQFAGGRDMSGQSVHPDLRIRLYVEAIEQLQRGEYTLIRPAALPDDVDPLWTALGDLARALDWRERTQHKLEEITAQLNAGLLLEDILDKVYTSFREIIPYDRIGLALLEDNGQIAQAYWAKTTQPTMQLNKGYAARLQGSSLETIIATGQPRIINDLEAYLRQKPSSDSTRLIVAEGIRSSLTCPLIVNSVPVGFLFFSSARPNTYDETHVSTFKQIAAQLAVIVEKGRLTSELAAQKAAVEQHNAELRHTNEVKNRFLGIAAHDLRNPLAQIQMVSNFLLDPETRLSPEELYPLLNDIREQARHMLTLLNDLLDVTQIEAGRLDLRLEPVSMDRFLADAVRAHVQMAAPKGTRVLLVSAHAGTAQADPRRLRQMLDNLVSNAVKYSPPGSTVRVTAERTRSGWRVNVQDEGPGITPEDRPLLFQHFARLSAQPTGGEKSTGLGLAITRRVVEAHGGQIGVDSQPGQGATFWFTLPV